MSYLKFRRALRRYYQFETPADKAWLLGPRKSAFWRSQYNLLAAGYRGVSLTDASLVAWSL